MTLDSHQNKYIRYFDNIRIIQSHICQQAEKFKIPQIDNTNVDRSLAIVHRALFNVLSRIIASPDVERHQGKLLYAEHAKIEERSLRSKEVLSMIRSKSLRKRSSSDTGQALLDDYCRQSLIASSASNGSRRRERDAIGNGDLVSGTSCPTHPSITTNRRCQSAMSHAPRHCYAHTLDDLDEHDYCLSDTASLGS